MDQDTSQGSPELTDTTQTAHDGGETREPEQIQRDIEQTRGELGETVEALAEKADVKAQAREKVDEVRQTVSAKTDEVASRAKQATPESGAQAAGQAAAAAKRNPLPLAVAGGVAVGFLLGRLTTRS